MRIRAVINPRAGGAIDAGADKLASEVKAAFESGGHEISVSLAEPRGIDAAIDAAIAAAPDAVLIGGGDGTIRCAAQRLAGTGIALAILPLGTVNRVARDLRIPLDPAEAAKSLARGGVRQIDVAEVNGRVFLCNSMIGLPPAIGAERQKLRGEAFGVRALGYFRILKSVLGAKDRLSLTVGPEGGERAIRVMSLAISNNLYSEHPSVVLTRDALDDGHLGIYISKHRTGLGLMSVLVRAGFGFWGGDSNFERHTADSVVIKSRKKRLKLSNDGEVETLDLPLRYTIRPKALNVLVPIASDI